MRRRYRSRLPSVYEPQNLFNTPGAGAGNQPMLNRAGRQEQEHRFSHARRTCLARTTLCHQRRPGIIPTRWTTLWPPLHAWRPSQPTASHQLQWKRVGPGISFRQHCINSKRIHTAVRGFIPLPVQARVIADTWRTNRPCAVVHVAEIHHEGTTRPGEALMRKMLWTMDAHVGRPS